ncbi:MAG: discoidin domain-containing protein [Chloroflexi bacterium]|nr:discoidin domain-containing protein [Chloroflexota bacterium]
MKKTLIGLCLFLVLLAGAAGAQEAEQPPRFINHRGQDLFLNGMNLAWISFARDLSDFDEVRFVAALDELVAAKGNTLRWWLHTNGSASPIYGEDGRVTGLGEDEIETLRRAADLAYERGILLMPTLWSHDMMNEQGSAPTDWNRLLIEDPNYTQAYIDNALTPLVTALADHPGIVAWEIFNEPEGTTEEFGWTDQRTAMPFIQAFVNRLAGAIHRADPDAKVTNGSWNLRVLTDVGGFTNSYTDERLIEAGGDPDGTLDFYSVHYYPEHFDEATSPFHNPASYWELDKPLVIGEFPAKAIMNLGMGFLPRTRLRNSIEMYTNLYDNGYAGALAWTFYSSPHGSLVDAKPGILWLNRTAPDAVRLDIGEVDRIPVVLTPIDNAFVPNTETVLPDYVDLTQVFSDAEDGADLSFEVTANSDPALVTPTISDAGALSLTFAEGTTGTAALEITATDSAGHYSRVEFVVQVIDPNRGNVALGKRAISSTVEAGYPPENALDGLANTRSSTEYADGQWLDVDLGGVFTLSQFVIKWEAAFGEHYQIQIWDGSAWQTVVEEPAGDGDIDDFALAEPIDARYVRMNGIRRGEEWGFSIWEFEIYGAAAEHGDLALETMPDSFANAPEATETAEATTVIADETLLHSFEADVEGWQLADYWAGGTGLAVSDAGASEGEGSLAISASMPGGTWQESGAFVQPSASQDWTAVDQLAMDVYLPEGATDFIGQIFVKTGADWTWANTPDTPLMPGVWTTLTADLPSMGDMADVREYGIKAGTSVTAFDGDILVDNVRLLVIAEATPGPVAGPEGEEVETVLNAITSVTPLAAEVGQYEKFELAIALDAAFNNPYDPQEIRVDAEFTAPSGRVIPVAGFYYQDFAYQGGRVVSSDDFSWRVRFTPQEVGEYRYTVTASTAESTVSSDEGVFTAAESDKPGFVRVDSRNPRYFAFDNGSPYFPVGLNMAWSTSDTIGDYTEWLDKLEASGGSFIRVWMAPWNMSIEWIDTGLGDYSRRQFRAYELDQVIALAEERGIYIMLTLLNHGQFNTATNPEWDQNPYNAANGGPCDVPQCFADHPEAIRYWEQRLRYIVARWGYSPNIMAWEWWNEVNWTPLASESVLAPWIERNSALIRDIDPYAHLLTHSGSPSALEGVWSPLDFTQDHFYDRDDFPRTFLTTIPEWEEAYPAKPFLVGEFGRASEALSFDRQGVELHIGHWSAPMNGAAGTAMTWWWDTYIDPNDLWDQLFVGVSSFFADEDLGAREWRRPESAFAERTRARVFGLQSDDRALLWVVSRDFSTQYLESEYLDNLRARVEDPFAIEFPEVSGAVLTVSALAPGSYTVELWDTLTGEVAETLSVESVDGSVQIPLPAFTRDWAIKIKAVD